MTWGLHFATQVRSHRYYARGPTPSKCQYCRGTNLPPSSRTLIWPWEPGTNDKASGTGSVLTPFTCSAQWVLKIKGVWGTFKVRSLWRDTAHSNFNVKYWNGMVFFVINPIPISSSFLAQPQFPHGFVSWQTWGGEKDTSGHWCCPSQERRGSQPSNVPQHMLW